MSRSRGLLLASGVVAVLSSLLAARGWAIAWFSGGRYLPRSLLLELALAIVLAAGAVALSAGLRRLTARLVTPWGRGSRFALLGVRLGVVLSLFVPLAFTAFQMHPPRIAARGTPAAAGLEWEDVRLRTDDGLELAAWLVPPPGDEAPLAVLAHGIGGNRETLLGPAALLHELGFGVLLFDFRGHGESEGWTVTFGRREALDVRAARAWLAARFPGRKVLGMGFSMGAASLLQSTCLGVPFDARVVDSSFSRLRGVAEARFSGLGPAFGAAWSAVSFWAYAFSGMDVDAVAPLDCAGQAARDPLFVVHGLEDRLIPAAHALEIVAKAPSARLWLVEGAGHIGAFAAPGYRERLEGFLCEAMGSCRASWAELGPE